MKVVFRSNLPQNNLFFLKFWIHDVFSFLFFIKQYKKNVPCKKIGFVEKQIQIKMAVYDQGK